MVITAEVRAIIKKYIRYSDYFRVCHFAGFGRALEKNGIVRYNTQRKAMGEDSIGCWRHYVTFNEAGSTTF